jgi:hypothetical protein
MQELPDKVFSPFRLEPLVREIKQRLGGYANSLSNGGSQLLAKSALTWRPEWRSGQWHPGSDVDRTLGATDLGFVRSVLDLDCSSFDREFVLYHFLCTSNLKGLDLMNSVLMEF